MKSKIIRWGNSLAVQLPSTILAQAKLEVSSPVSIHGEAGKIIIEAIPKSPRKLSLPFSEADLLEGLDAYSAHADELLKHSGTETGS